MKTMTPEEELLVALGSIFDALHELADTCPQSLRRTYRVEAVWQQQKRAGLCWSHAQICGLLDAELGVVPDSLGATAIEAAYAALQRQDETNLALSELRRRLGPAQSILDGDDAAQELRNLCFVPSES